MAASSALSCKLCKNPFATQGKRVPVLLPCGHGGCKDCVNKHLQTASTCPFDQKPVTIPPGGLARNLQLLEVLQAGAAEVEEPPAAKPKGGGNAKQSPGAKAPASKAAANAPSTKKAAAGAKPAAKAGAKATGKKEPKAKKKKAAASKGGDGAGVAPAKKTRKQKRAEAAAMAAAFVNKTTICKHFQTEAGCKYGDNCKFLHGKRIYVLWDMASCPQPQTASGGTLSIGKIIKALRQTFVTKDDVEMGFECLLKEEDDTSGRRNEIKQGGAVACTYAQRNELPIMSRGLKLLAAKSVFSIVLVTDISDILARLIQRIVDAGNDVTVVSRRPLPRLPAAVVKTNFARVVAPGAAGKQAARAPKEAKSEKPATKEALTAKAAAKKAPAAAAVAAAAPAVEDEDDCVFVEEEEIAEGPTGSQATQSAPVGIMDSLLLMGFTQEDATGALQASKGDLMSAVEQLLADRHAAAADEDLPPAYDSLAYIASHPPAPTHRSPPAPPSAASASAGAGSMVEADVEEDEEEEEGDDSEEEESSDEPDSGMPLWAKLLGAAAGATGAVLVGAALHNHLRKDQGPRRGKA